MVIRFDEIMPLFYHTEMYTIMANEGSGFYLEL